VVILNKSNTEHDTAAHNYARDFERQTGKTIEFIDADSAEAIEIAKIHDIMQFPAILVTDEDGGFIQVWPDMQSWPTFSELSYYTR